MLPTTQYALRLFTPLQYLFHAKKRQIAQELPLTWHHSLSTLNKTLFGDYPYEMSRLQQFNDSR